MPHFYGNDEEQGDDQWQEDDDEEDTELNLATYLGLLENSVEDDEYQSILYGKDNTEIMGTIRHFSEENSLSSEYQDDYDEDSDQVDHCDVEGDECDDDDDDHENETHDDGGYDDGDDSMHSSPKETDSADEYESSDVQDGMPKIIARRVTTGDITNTIVAEAAAMKQVMEWDEVNNKPSAKKMSKTPQNTSKAAKDIDMGTSIGSSALNQILGDQIERLKQIRLLSMEVAEAQILRDHRALVDARSNDIGDGTNIWDIMCGGDEEDSDDERRVRPNADADRSREAEWEDSDEKTKKDRNLYYGENAFRELQGSDEDGYYVEVRKGKQPKKQQQQGSGTRKVSVPADGTSVGGNRFDVEERHKAVLTDMVMKRKQDDDDAQFQIDKATAKRKKFKEALLEKALKTRNLSEGSPGKSFEEIGEIGSKGVGKKSRSNSGVTRVEELEDQRKGEVERVEQIAAIRRKFKEQHKNILLSLMNKHKEEEKKAELLTLAEEEKRRKRKLKGDALLARRAEALLHQADPLGMGGTPAGKDPIQGASVRVGGVGGGASDRLKSVSAASSKRGSLAPVQATAAGSGLAGVRAHRAHSAEAQTLQHRYSNDDPTDLTVLGQEEVEVGVETECDAVELSEEEEKIRKMKRAAAKLHKDKIAAYLLGLFEQKKKEEIDKKKKEESRKRRVLILSTRVQNEASERKLMGQEDKLQQRVIAPGHVSSGGMNAILLLKVLREKEKEKKLREKEKDKDRLEKGGNKEGKDAREGGGKDREKSSARVSAEASDAIVTRLNKNKGTGAGAGGSEEGVAPSGVGARDFSDWKRKNAVPPEAQVFAMTGWYPCVKQALLDRGWHFNPDPASPYFDLKWTLRSIDVSQETLLPNQLTNHFLKNVAITTKVGLIKSLQSLVWVADVHSDDIIPRGYDLTQPQDTQAFIDDFRFQKAECWLKGVYEMVTGLMVPDQDQLIVNTESSEGCDEYSPVPTPRSRAETAAAKGKTGTSAQVISVNSAVFEACCSVLEKLLRPLEDGYLDQQHTEKESPTTNSYKNQLAQASAPSGLLIITPLEWELIGGQDMFHVGHLPPLAPEPVDCFLREKDIEKGPRGRGVDRKKARQELSARELATSQVQTMMPMTADTLKRIHRILCQLRLTDRSQAGLNGKGLDAKNMWIVKPAAKSRGRGISTFADLPKLLKYVEAGSGFSGQWVVQKYMENPLVVAKRKFDLRQWVLVTDWNPLTIWFYDECYARFSVQDYDTSDSSLDNNFVHLVNNSITKDHKEFHGKVVAENGVEVQDCMWSHSDLADWINFKTRKEVMKMENLKKKKEKKMQKEKEKEEKEKRKEGKKVEEEKDGVCGDPTHDLSPSKEEREEKEEKERKEGKAQVKDNGDDEVKELERSEINNEKEVESGKCKMEDVDEKGYSNLMKNKIHPRMKDIAKWSLMCAAQAIEHRKSSWELYGFDYMVDDEYNAWLIEINSSPACDYSTAVTSRYVQKALVELLSVVLDVRQWDGANKTTRGECPDTGGWECIHKGVQTDIPVAAFGTDMTLKGEAMKLPRRAVPTPILHTNNNNNNHDDVASGSRSDPKRGGSNALRSGVAPSIEEEEEDGSDGDQQHSRVPQGAPHYKTHTRRTKNSTSNATSSSAFDAAQGDRGKGSHAKYPDPALASPTQFNDSDDDSMSSQAHTRKKQSPQKRAQSTNSFNSNNNVNSIINNNVNINNNINNNNINNNDKIISSKNASADKKEPKRKGQGVLAAIPIKTFTIDF